MHDAAYFRHPDAPPGQRWQERQWLQPRRACTISDYHEPFKSMATGEMTNSKSRYRAEIRARGFEELGNEIQECTGGEFEPSDWRDDLAETASEYGVNLGAEISRRDG